MFNFILILYFKHNGMSSTKIQFCSFSSMYNHIYFWNFYKLQQAWAMKNSQNYGNWSNEELYIPNIDTKFKVIFKILLFLYPEIKPPEHRFPKKIYLNGLNVFVSKYCGYPSWKI